MDIYSAELHVKKLLEYVEYVYSSNHNMYSKSKMRLQDVSNTCVSIVNMISEILEDSAFEETDDEFRGLDTAEMYDTMLNIRNSVVDYRYSNDNLSPHDLKRVFAEYAKILQTVGTLHIPYTEASECAKLIWNWFNTRFILSKSNSPNFKYSMAKVPSWIASIVIRYGFEMSINRTNQFCNEMNSWCDRLLSAGHTYPLPYSVYQVDKYPKKGDATLQAVVIWDILMDSGFDKLCGCDVSLEADAIYEFCVKVNPPVLDRYCNYKYDAHMLDIVGITEEGVV